MDSTLKQMLDGFRFSVDNYTATLGPSNTKLARARELLEALASRAEDGADIASISVDPAFAELGALIGELASEQPATAGKAPAAPPAGAPSAASVPPASVPAAGYHMAYDTMSGAARESNAPYYERIFEIESAAENAIHFNTLLVEDGVLLEISRQPLMEAARETLEKAAEAHSPTVDYQQNLALEVYGKVETVPELEYEGTRMAELSNVEHPWDAMYIEVIGLLPACAQAIEAFGPTEENVAKLRNSHRFMADFMGVTWDRVFEDPRYLLFWNRVFWPKVPAEKRARYGVSSAEGWRDLLKEKFYDPFVRDQPPVREDPSRAVVRFWRKEYPSRRTLELLETPPRPEVETG
ncbi:hypothetical protein JW921_01375 [Candidatus Fermentibacterales bacterium]|nr:hypothetical protein [Candidatus Fermentibacterales bacterium]